jgi:dynactin complex subunit
VSDKNTIIDQLTNDNASLAEQYDQANVRVAECERQVREFESRLQSTNTNAYEYDVIKTKFDELKCEFEMLTAQLAAEKHLNYELQNKADDLSQVSAHSYCFYDGVSCIFAGA